MSNSIPLAILEPTNEKSIPQRVHLGAPSIHYLSKIFVDFRGAKRVAILSGEFINDELVENCLDILEVRHVASSANDSVVSDRVQTLYILETSQRSIRC